MQLRRARDRYLNLGILSIVDLINLYFNDNGVIARAKESKSRLRSKHILIHHHLIQEIIERGDT